jgi:hypothetical protein
VRCLVPDCQTARHSAKAISMLSDAQIHRAGHFNDPTELAF